MANNGLGGELCLQLAEYGDGYWTPRLASLPLHRLRLGGHRVSGHDRRFASFGAGVGDWQNLSQTV